ncbi:TPA: thioesterase II family protein [Streptococcus agalactiae]
MPRYDIVDLSRTIYLAKEEFKKDIKKYEEYLKVSGNNYKYPYIHQISIYNMDPKATACAEFDYWKSIGRSVKRGEKGIPLLDIDSGRIKYIFDIRQTVSINHNISEVKLWKYDSKKHLNLLDELIDKFKEKDSKLLLSQEDKIDALVESNVRGKFNKILESLSDESLKSIQKVDLFNLLKESVKISISERMEVSYQLKEENLSLLSKISSSDIDKVLSISANISKNILLDLGSEIKRLEILDNKDLISIFLPTLRADFVIDEDYQDTKFEKLESPILGLMGDKDQEMKLEELKKWQDYTTKNFSYKYIDGKHMFVNTSPEMVIREIKSYINENVKNN